MRNVRQISDVQIFLCVNCIRYLLWCMNECLCCAFWILSSCSLHMLLHQVICKKRILTVPGVSMASIYCETQDNSLHDPVLVKGNSSPCPGTMSGRSWSWRTWFSLRNEILCLIAIRRNFHGAPVSLKFCLVFRLLELFHRGARIFFSLKVKTDRKHEKFVWAQTLLYTPHWTSLKVKKIYQNRSHDP